MYFASTEWVLGDRLLFVDGDAVALQLVDERLQAEGEVLHCFTILKLEVGVLLLQKLVVAFFARSEPTRIAAIASHASFAELFTPTTPCTLPVQQRG